MFIKNSSLFLIKKSHITKISKVGNKSIKNIKNFKKNFFSLTFLKFFLTNQRNKFRFHHTLIFFKLLPLFSQSKILKKTTIKKIKFDSHQFFLFIRKNNLNYKKRFKNKRLNFKRMLTSARFFFLKRKKKLYKPKELFFFKSNHFINKYCSWNFLLKKKNYFKDFFFFSFLPFPKNESYQL